jgi:hypothetical protein
MPDLTLPNGFIPSVEPEDRGAAVWGIQRGLNRSKLFESNLTPDGIYGEQTESRVRRYQGKRGLVQDGVFGPATSMNLSQLLQKKAVGDKVLPGRITYSIVSLESGDLIAANNWSVSGGVDLSYAQRRVYGPPFDDAAVERAFDALYQFQLLTTQLRERHDHFWTSPNEVDTHEMAWRLAVLNHNYPSGANIIARDGIAGLSSYWNTAQSWVLQHSRVFEDGAPVRTPLEWCQHYALGAPAHGHEGLAVRGVTAWDVT